MAKLKSLIKTGFGLGVGINLSFILFILLGLLFFIPGFIMFTKEKKAGKSGDSEQIAGIVLMALGVVCMMGMGAGTLFDSISDMF